MVGDPMRISVVVRLFPFCVTFWRLLLPSGVVAVEVDDTAVSRAFAEEESDDKLDA